jgi:hypothetical protein
LELFSEVFKDSFYFLNWEVPFRRKIVLIAMLASKIAEVCYVPLKGDFVKNFIHHKLFPRR